MPRCPRRRSSERLVELAQAGKSVVRLKGGDPFTFGRGGEEAEALVDAGVGFEVVPGVTAGIAAPAYAGIPVTHRDEASAVAFVTGHEDPGKEASAIDWEALARFPGTLVLYMGVKRLGEIARALIAEGRAPGEPAAVIERGTLPGQRVVTAPLAEIAATVEEEGIKPPAITVIGPVAGRRDSLDWLERRPLHGKKIVVTRARAQASELSERLRALGAEVVEAPAIRIVSRAEDEDVRRAVADIHTYSLICLTSRNGVEELCRAMVDAGRDARALANATIAAVGPATAEALGELGVIPDIVAERSLAEGLLEALAEVDVQGRPVLVATAAGARDTLPEGLRARGAEVDVVALYETVAEPTSPKTLEAMRDADYVTFTSSSTVTNFLDAAGGVPDGFRVVTIGPVTSETAVKAGIRVDVEAEQHDIAGLVEAIVSDVSQLSVG